MLQNDPQGNVIDASFAVIGSSGVELADVTKHLLSLKDVTKDDVAPIAAFQVNLVGPVNGGNATFSSGAGFINYAAQNVLDVLSSEPSCTESGYVTAENSNTTYGDLCVIPAYSFVQSFKVGFSAMATLRRHGKLRPSLRVPAGFLTTAESQGV